MENRTRTLIFWHVNSPKIPFFHVSISFDTYTVFRRKVVKHKHSHGLTFKREVRVHNSFFVRLLDEVGGVSNQFLWILAGMPVQKLRKKTNQNNFSFSLFFSYVFNCTRVRSTCSIPGELLARITNSRNFPRPSTVRKKSVDSTHEIGGDW